ncbi:hypothetical protein [Shinella sp. BYT-45]|uniref:hypothetical protein n=1 Tax=Shinella sp. BYT-45 TaxID=3377377 RepID=UPI003980352F
MTLEISYVDQGANAARNNSPDDAELVGDESLLARLTRKFLTKTNTFLLVVLVPSILAAIYYGYVVSGQYVAEARMIVRTIGVSERFDTSEKRDGRSIIGGDSLTQDSYIVANYLQSPEIVRTLNEEIGLAKRFSQSDIDYLSRLPKDASFEELHRYWTKQIGTYVDGPSGIIIFTVRAFSPEDSVTILNAAMQAADRMIDKISEKAKRDLIVRAEADVANGLSAYTKALDDLRQYQNASGILDPKLSAQMVSTVVGKLVEERLGLVVRLNSLEAANAADSAAARQLKRSIKALDEQIQQYQASLAGESSTGVQLSQNLTDFSRLETRRLVTQAIYESTVRNLDTSRSTAIRRTTFISVFSAPELPEKSKYPERFSSWIMFSVGIFTLWVTAIFLWMSIEDHRT